MTTTQAPITLRPALPTLADGLAFARLLDEAQERAFRMMLGRRAHEIVAKAFTRRGHDLSYEHVLFATQGDRIVGMASGYTSEAHRRSTDDALVAAAGRHRHRLAVCERMAGRVMRFIETVPDGDFYLRALAVEPGHRSAGIGTRLMEAMQLTARTAGSQRFALDVAATNRGGRRLYARFGMTEEAESRKWFGIPNSNLIRMVKPL